MFRQGLAASLPPARCFDFGRIVGRKIHPNRILHKEREQAMQYLLLQSENERQAALITACLSFSLNSIESVIKTISGALISGKGVAEIQPPGRHLGQSYLITKWARRFFAHACSL